jgi:hypothetical protein
MTIREFGQLETVGVGSLCIWINVEQELQGGRVFVDNGVVDGLVAEKRHLADGSASRNEEARDRKQTRVADKIVDGLH